MYSVKGLRFISLSALLIMFVPLNLSPRPLSMPSFHAHLFFFLLVTLKSVAAQSDFRAQAADNPPFSSDDNFNNLVLTSANTPDEAVLDTSNSPKVQLNNEDQCSAETPPNSRRMRSRSDTYCPYNSQAPFHEFMGPELTGPELQSNPAQEPFWRKIPFLQNWFRPPPKKPAKKLPILDFDVACRDPTRQVRVCSIWASFLLPIPELMPTLPFCRYSTFKVHEHKLF